ncbi:MAG: hypothetical protein SCK28_09325 [Bacillota bacterium]|nr:hypothetical protein [Bacillota bacterium]
MSNKRCSKALMTLLITTILLLGVTGIGYAYPSDQVSIDVHHILLKLVEDNKLEVREIIKFNNAGDVIEVDTSLPTEEQPTLRVSLPKYFDELIIGEGANTNEELQQLEIGMGIIKDIPPGEYKLDLLYNLLMSGGDKFVIDKQIIYNTESFYILAPENILVMGEGVVLAGNAPMGDTNYSQYFIENTVPGTELSIVAVKGEAPNSSSFLNMGYSNTAFHSPGHIRFWNNSPFRGVEPHLFMLVLVGGLAIGLIVYIKKWKDNKSFANNGQNNNDDKEFKVLLAKQKILLEKIQEAKEQLDRNEIDQDAYEKMLVLYKEKLTKVKVKLKMLSE